MNTKNESPDELKQAITSRITEIKIAGRKLRLQKWTLRKGVLYSGRLVDLVKELGGAKADIFKADLSKLADDGVDKIIDIFVNTVQVNNFDTPENAAAWVEDLTMDEAVYLLHQIIEQNFRPLAQKLGDVLKSINEKASSLSAMRRPTSSLSSSPPGTPSTKS